MHQNLGYLFVAFAVTWVGLFAYLFYIQRRLTEARRRLDWLDEDAKSRRSVSAGPH